jgi:hypothetical protein
MLEQ